LTKQLRGCINLSNLEDTFYKKSKKNYFVKIYNFLQNVNKIMNILHQNKDVPSILKFKGDNKIVESLMLNIEYKIDLRGNNVIKKGLDEELDTYINIYGALEDILTDYAKILAENYKIKIAVVYQPQLGFLAEVQSKISQWELIYKNDTFFYYKNNITEELDKEYGDIKNNIEDRELEIMLKLKESIDSYKIYFNMLIDYIAIVDALHSLSLYAKRDNLVKPDITNQIEIEKGRNFFYPSNFSVVINKNTILTGPNSSGKTTLLKNIGIYLVLCQMGSFIPAVSAKFPIIDKLLTKIESKESISNKISSFMSDILQIEHIISESTAESLCIIDEMGKGTNIKDGISVFIAIMNYLKKTKVITASNYQEFFMRNDVKDLLNVNYFYVNRLENSMDIKKGIFNNKSSIDLIEGEYKDLTQDVESSNEESIKETEKWAIKKINNRLMNKNE
ncbi:DNA mismatch repair protein Msh5, partial [Spraguea lophii 42_110]